MILSSFLLVPCPIFFALFVPLAFTVTGGILGGLYGLFRLPMFDFMISFPFPLMSMLMSMLILMLMVTFMLYVETSGLSFY